MSKAVEILDALQARAWELHIVDDPAQRWVKDFQATSTIRLERGVDSILAPRSEAKTANVVEPQNSTDVEPNLPSSTSEEEDDLIQLAIRA
jgi:hypothetical protein